MSEPEPKHWWHTLPGVLTAFAACLTAFAGLVAVLRASGVHERAPAPATDVSRPTAPDGAAPGAGTGGVATATGAGLPRYRRFPDEHIDTRTSGGRGAVYNGCAGGETVEIFVCMGTNGARGGVKFILPPGEVMYFDVDRGSTYRYRCGGVVDTTCPSPDAWVPLVDT